MQTVVAIDVSGSTSGSKAYWNKVKDIVESCSVDTKFIEWDTSASVVSRDALLDRAERTRGGGATSPSCFIRCLPTKVGKLVLVTDGQVDERNVQACEEHIASLNKTFDKVDIHMINTGGPINLSVPAPFIRSSEFNIFVDDEKTAAGNSSVPLNLDEWTLEKYLADGQTLRAIVVAQTVGLSNHTLAKELAVLKKRLLSEYQNSKSFEYSGPVGSLVAALQKGDYNGAKTLALQLARGDLDSNDVAVRIEQDFASMFSACTEKKNFGISLLRSHRANRASNVQNVVPEQTDSLDGSSSFQCPIFLDDDVPCILLGVPVQPILADADKDSLDAVINCPLIFLRHQNLVDRLVSVIDHAVGVKSLQNGLFEASPITRRPLSGALTLGDAEDHCKAFNSSLARVMTGSKLLGNQDMWFAVFREVVLRSKSLGWISEDANVLLALDRQLKYRLVNPTKPEWDCPGYPSSR